MGGKKRTVAMVRAGAQYEALREQLLAPQYAPARARTLAHWVEPNDRRMPLAFLEWTVDALLATPFDKLAATPGVGRKKIGYLVGLLRRVADLDNTASEGNGRVGEGRTPGRGKGPAVPDFNPGKVSEAAWQSWRQTVHRCNLERETLGRVAPSLRNITRVIWNTPLAEYLDLSLADLSRKKTYGDKRVRAVLEVFFGLHQLIGSVADHDGLAVRVVPKRIDRVERWVLDVLVSGEVPRDDELFENLVAPLLEQVRVDGSAGAVSLAELRLGVGGPVVSLRQAARRMGLTRARAYQLLNEVNDILLVRWPQGRCHVHQLLQWRRREAGEEPPERFEVAAEVFYPVLRRGGAATQTATPRP